jgi:predicted RNA-binding protein with PIN domain
VLVFDAYLVEDNKGTEFVHDGYKVVFTKADQTADSYIEKLMYELGPDYSIRMVTGDKLLQFSAVHSGILRMTAQYSFPFARGFMPCVAVNKRARASFNFSTSKP